MRRVFALMLGLMMAACGPQEDLSIRSTTHAIYPEYDHWCVGPCALPFFEFATDSLCNWDARVAVQFDMQGKPDAMGKTKKVATLKHWYSPHCDTTWTDLTMEPGQRAQEMTVYTDSMNVYGRYACSCGASSKKATYLLAPMQQVVNNLGVRDKMVAWGDADSNYSTIPYRMIDPKNP